VLLVSLAVLAACAGGDDTGERRTQAPGEIQPTGDDSDAVVARVIDGDSVELDIDGGLVESRLIGINAPELSDCQGPGAAEVLTSVAGGRSVTIRSFGSDRFGRLLVDLSIDAESVNEAMVRLGWALAQHDNEHGAAALWVAEMERASASGLGMWDLPTACPPAPDDVQIVGVEADPPGPDDDVLEEEWIELENTGSATVDLSGWAVRDESTSNRFVFDDVQLGAGQRLRLRTGCGVDDGRDHYWCSPAGVWSNRGETALLLGPSGSIQDWVYLE